MVFKEQPRSHCRGALTFISSFCLPFVLPPGLAGTQAGRGSEDGEVVSMTKRPSRARRLPSVLFSPFRAPGSVSAVGQAGVGEDVWSKGIEMGTGESRRGNEGPEIKK